MDWRIPYAALREAFPQVESDILKVAVSKYGNNVHQAAEYILNDVAPPDLSLSALRQAASSRNARARSRSGSGTNSDAGGARTGGGSNRGVYAGGGGDVSAARGTGNTRTPSSSTQKPFSPSSSLQGKSSHVQSSTGRKSPGHGKDSNNRSKDAPVKWGSSGTQSKTPSEIAGQTASTSASNGGAPALAPGSATGRVAASSSSAAVVIGSTRVTEIEELPSSPEQPFASGKSVEETHTSADTDEDKASWSSANATSDRNKGLVNEETDGLVASCIRFAQTFVEPTERQSGQNEEAAKPGSSFKAQGSSSQSDNGDCSSDSEKLHLGASQTGHVDNRRNSSSSEFFEADSQLGGTNCITLLVVGEKEQGDVSADISSKEEQSDTAQAKAKGQSHTDVEQGLEGKSSTSASNSSGSDSGAEEEEATSTNPLSQQGKAVEDKEQAVAAHEEGTECHHDDVIVVTEPGASEVYKENNDKGIEEPASDGDRESRNHPDEQVGDLDEGRSGKTDKEEPPSALTQVDAIVHEEKKEESSEDEDSGAGAGTRGEGAWEGGRAQGSAALSEQQLVPVHKGTECTLVEINDVQDMAVSSPGPDWTEINEGTITSLEELVSEALSWKKIAEVRALRAEAEATEVAAAKARVEAKKGGLTEWLQVVELREKVERSREAYEQRAGDVHGEKAVLATEARELRSRLVHVAAEKAAALERLTEVENALEARISAARKALKEAQEELNTAREAAYGALDIEKAKMAKVNEEAEKLEQEADTCTKLREFLISQGNSVDALQGEVAGLLEDVETLKNHLEIGFGGSVYVPVADPTTVHQSTTLQLYPLVSSSSAAGSRTSYMQPSGSFLMNVQEGCMSSNVGVNELRDACLELHQGCPGNLSSSGHSTVFSQLYQSLTLGSHVRWSPQRNVILGNTPLSAASLNGSRCDDAVETQMQLTAVGEANMAGEAGMTKFGLCESGTRSSQGLLNMQLGSNSSLKSGRADHLTLPNVLGFSSQEEEHNMVDFFEGEAAEQIDYEMRLAMSQNESVRAAAETHESCFQEKNVIERISFAGGEWLGETVPASGMGAKSGLDDDGWQLLEMGGGAMSKGKDDVVCGNGNGQSTDGVDQRKKSTMLSQSSVHQPAPDAAVLS